MNRIEIRSVSVPEGALVHALLLLTFDALQGRHVTYRLKRWAQSLTSESVADLCGPLISSLRDLHEDAPEWRRVELPDGTIPATRPFVKTRAEKVERVQADAEELYLWYCDWWREWGQPSLEAVLIPRRRG